MAHKIFSGADRARELGLKGGYRELIKVLSKRIPYLEWSGEIDTNQEHALPARVDGGRWCATCECGASYYVEPKDPIGYCVDGCGNANQDGRARLILFPADRDEIERALLEREYTGTETAYDRLGTQAVLYPHLIGPKVLPRNWDGETVEQLREDHRKEKEKHNG